MRHMGRRRTAFYALPAYAFLMVLATAGSKGDHLMQNRRLFSYTIFVLAVVVLLLLGLALEQWAVGIFVGLAFALVGIIFYRRGK